MCSVSVAANTPGMCDGVGVAANTPGMGDGVSVAANTPGMGETCLTCYLLLLLPDMGGRLEQ